MDKRSAGAIIAASVLALLAASAPAQAQRDFNGACPAERGRNLAVASGETSPYDDDSKARMDVVVDSRGGTSVSVELGSDPETRATLDSHSAQSRCVPYPPRRARMPR